MTCSNHKIFDSVSVQELGLTDLLQSFYTIFDTYPIFKELPLQFCMLIADELICEQMQPSLTQNKDKFISLLNLE